jgi:hypothetical protein
VAAKKKKTLPTPPTGLGAAGLFTPAKGTGQSIKGVSQVSELPPPPVGTYDPIIDYNAGAAQRGYGQTLNDAQTLFEQGQEDYGLGLGDLTRGRDRALQDVGTSRTRANQDYWTNTNDLARQYGILGRQQAESAAQRGVTSAGLLGKSAQVRAANQAHDQQPINTANLRANEDFDMAQGRVGQDFDRSKLGLDLGNARQFGGFNGQVINNPLTGSPYFGSLLTSVTRAGAENNAYQAAAAGQRADQANAMGYISPLLLTGQPGIRTPQPGEPGYDEYLARARSFGRRINGGN